MRYREKIFAAFAALYCAAVTAAPTYVVEGDDGYNCWPMISAVGGRLVCVYSMGNAHDPGERGRGAFARYSDDGGVTWSPRRVVASDPQAGISVVGRGNDADGAAFFWIRRLGVEPRHALYRTRDGVAFEAVSAPRLEPNAMQITDIFPVEGGLMCLWYSDDYSPARTNKCWGTLFSADGGRSWRQRVVENGLSRTDWPTEPSVAVLGGGRLLGIARSESGGSQFELTSTDWGATWTKRRTNIGDVLESTTSLVPDGAGGLRAYYFQRGAGALKVREARADDVFANPLGWPEPEIVAWGCRNRPYDSGNVNAVLSGGRTFAVFYAGGEKNCRVLVSAASETDDWRCWAGKRVVFFGDSITDSIHVGCRTNYWGFLAERMNFRAEVFGKNGARWSGLPAQVEAAKRQLPAESVDAVFLFFGTNDFNGGVPQGDWYSVAEESVEVNGRAERLKKRILNLDPATSRGAINRGLKLVRDTYPHAQIILLTPVHRGYAKFSEKNVQPEESYSRRTGLFIDDYVEDVRMAGRLWSAPVIDLFAESGLLPTEKWADPLIANPGRDRLHPSTAGHERLARLIEMKLRSLPASYR